MMIEGMQTPRETGSPSKLCASLDVSRSLRMNDGPQSAQSNRSIRAATASATHSDILLLYVARGVRGFGDGFAIIILPAYLSAIGFSPGEIGLIASASLLG
ncbi:MAG TPA: hypothetical protein VJZ74_05550, partial [Pseudolabrys sp.]|nr:hypothetical protein [Pseudolabrys sp.]